MARSSKEPGPVGKTASSREEDARKNAVVHRGSVVWGGRSNVARPRGRQLGSTANGASRMLDVGGLVRAFEQAAEQATDIFSTKLLAFAHASFNLAGFDVQLGDVSISGILTYCVLM